MASGANPILVIAESLPAHLAELKVEREKLVARLVALNAEIATAESHAAISPPTEAPEEKGAKR